MLKKWVTLVVIALTAIAMFGFLGCAVPEIETGTLKIQFNNQISRSTLVPDIIMETATY